MPRRAVVGVMGGGGSGPGSDLARSLGGLLARRGVHLLTGGGGGGTMAAVSAAFAAVPERVGSILAVLPGIPAGDAFLATTTYSVYTVVVLCFFACV